MDTHNFRELKTWQISIDFVITVYRVCSQFPEDERYGLISQIKRSAVSIPSNIAEGSGRGSNKDFARFLSISLSSSYELETQLTIARRLDFVSNTAHEELVSKLQEIQKMLFSLQKKIESRNSFPLRVLSYLLSFF